MKQDDRRGLGAGLLEENAHAGGTHADEHSDEPREPEIEKKGDASSPPRPYEQRLGCARRASDPAARP